MRAWLASGPVALVLLVGCTQPRTEIVARVDSDMTQGPTETLTAIRVRVLSTDESLPRLDQRFELGVGAEPILLPAELGILPRDDGRSVIVEVDANRDDTLLFTQRAEAAFVSGRTLLLSIFLADACRTISCDATMTCDSGECAAPTRSELPDYEL